MLYALPRVRGANLSTRIALIAAFAALTAITARITIPVQPVPFTLQTLAVLLSGLVLGWRDGALSQMLYVGMIAIGMPLDVNMIGTAALVSPTAGFLVGFIPTAAVAGIIAQISGKSLWMRWLAGTYAVFVLFAFGIAWLAIHLRISPNTAFNLVDQFIGLDIVKALVAAGLAETGRALISQNFDV